MNEDTNADWRELKSAASRLKNQGDFFGAISAISASINLSKPHEDLARETALSLNYLAALYRISQQPAASEEAALEAIELARKHYPKKI